MCAKGRDWVALTSALHLGGREKALCIRSNKYTGFSTIVLVPHALMHSAFRSVDIHGPLDTQRSGSLRHRLLLSFILRRVTVECANGPNPVSTWAGIQQERWPSRSPRMQQTHHLHIQPHSKARGQLTLETIPSTA